MSSYQTDTALALDTVANFPPRANTPIVSDLIDLKVHEDGSVMLAVPADSFKDQTAFGRLLETIKDLPACPALIMDLAAFPADQISDRSEDLAGALLALNTKQDGELAVTLSTNHPLRNKLESYGLTDQDFLRVRSTTAEAMEVLKIKDPLQSVNGRELLFAELQRKSDAREQEHLDNLKVVPVDHISFSIYGDSSERTIVLQTKRLSPDNPGWNEFSKEMAGPGSVIVDLSGCKSADSGAINYLLKVHKALKADGGELVLKNPSPNIAESLHAKHFDRVFTIVT